MMDRRFRFGVLAEPKSYTGAGWRAVARRVEELGYSTLVMPDGLHLLAQLLAPLPAVAVAAAVTTRLHVGTYVLASTVRLPRIAAWEANSLATLTDHRFELGIGTGNQWVNQAVVDEVGMPETTPAQRLTLVRRTVEQLRELETTRTPVMIAAGGRRSRALAGAVADIVTLASDPLAARSDITEMIAEIESAADARGGQIEYHMNIHILDEIIPPYLAPLLGDKVDALLESDSMVMLRGTPQQKADEIQRRRDDFGFSYITVNAMHLETFAPVVELLDGQ